MAIKIKNLSYSYSGEKKEALKNINIDIFDGQLCGVLGRNLTGKSTLCYALTGFIPHFLKEA